MVHFPLHVLSGYILDIVPASLCDWWLWSFVATSAIWGERLSDGNFWLSPDRARYFKRGWQKLARLNGKVGGWTVKLGTRWYHS